MQVPVSGSATSYSTLASNILLYDMQFDTVTVNIFFLCEIHKLLKNVFWCHK